ncbi:hypothetical protein OEZ85_002550 [Tetradesmus obliquus]|uniref:Uncharacterized protein n=1 Tax=Tetradesmus obliquus TaxID=3088 RepID=A0ABY8TXV6_TETOB|nr:hypothetical protein OEZ85_002550 [Tetradesmus obliquus]
MALSLVAGCPWVLNEQDSRGRTPLLAACYAGRSDCAQLLIESGSNIFACDKDGNGVLHLAAINGHTQLLQLLLLKAEAQAITPQLTAAVNLSGFSPLHYAAFAGNAACVRALLAAGVDALQGSWGEYDRSACQETQCLLTHAHCSLLRASPRMP